MTEAFASEILEHLVPMRAHLNGLVSSLCYLDRRLEIVDGQLAKLVANQACQANKLKRINGRLDRIEQRLDLRESPSLICKRALLLRGAAVAIAARGVRFAHEGADGVVGDVTSSAFTAAALGRLSL